MVYTGDLTSDFRVRVIDERIRKEVGNLTPVREADE